MGSKHPPRAEPVLQSLELLRLAEQELLEDQSRLALLVGDPWRGRLPTMTKGWLVQKVPSLG